MSIGCLAPANPPLEAGQPEQQHDGHTWWSDGGNQMGGGLFDEQQAASWLHILHGDSRGYINVCTNNDWSGRCFTDLDQAAAYLRFLDTQRPVGIYARVTSLRAVPEAGRRGGRRDSLTLPTLWADLDIAGPGHAWQLCPPDCDKQHKHVTTPLPPDVEACKRIVAQAGLPDPTVWVHSGGGTYPYWFLDKPWHLETSDDYEQAAALAQGWQKLVAHAAEQLGWHYGTGIGDLARVLRVPGSVNRKDGLERPCRIIEGTSTRYPAEHLLHVFTEQMRLVLPNAPSPLTGGVRAAKVERPADTGVSPGDDYAARTPWPTIMTELLGASHLYDEDGESYWLRPGRAREKGLGKSASTNYMGSDLLYVFTDAWPPLEGGQSYSKFAVYAMVRHGGDYRAAAKDLAQQGYGAEPPNPSIEYNENLSVILGYPVDQAPPVHALAESAQVPAAPTPGPATILPSAGSLTAAVTGDPPPPPVEDVGVDGAGGGGDRPELDVSNELEAADWARHNIGAGKLAGLFLRGDQVVHTPRVGESGYQRLTEDQPGRQRNDDGPAQVRVVDPVQLAARISYLFRPYRLVKSGEAYKHQGRLFPDVAARTALSVPDMLPNLRRLRGVINTPVVRPDGTLLTEPGYDDATGLLHLPQPGLVVPAVPDAPSAGETAAAVGLLGEMLAGFPFVSEHDRANTIGVLLTPLLRLVCPPPYKLHLIEAHQPGSGKTLLANLGRWIHGGVFRADMPDEEDELGKQVSSILTVTTGAVVIFDNVNGILRSAKLTSLLTNGTWEDRLIGTGRMIKAVNDRIWTITGNNLMVGGDFARRTLKAVIDPGCPNPEARTDFAIPNLEKWVHTNRGRLLAALLTMVRAWAAAGRPLAGRDSSDSYADWVCTVRGILSVCGVGGVFDHQDSRVETGSDDEEWGVFLAAVWKAFRSQNFTAKTLIERIRANPSLHEQATLIPLDALPGDLELKVMRSGLSSAGMARSVTSWMRNRNGRWANGFTVRKVGADADKTALWRVETQLQVVDGGGEPEPAAADWVEQTAFPAGRLA